MSVIGVFMAYQLCYEHIPDFVHVKSVGEVSPHEVSDTLKEIISSPGWTENTSLLVDYRNGNRDHFTYNDISMIAEIICDYSKKMGTGRCAFLVTNPHEKWITRMYHFLCSGKVKQEVMVFEEYETAADWLTRKK